MLNRTLFLAVALLGVACSTNGGTSGSCPEGCDLTAQGSCEPESPDISYQDLAPCQVDTDCCTGTCDLTQSIDGGPGICSHVGGTSGSIGTGGTVGASSSASSTGGTSHGASSSGSGTSGGGVCSVVGGVCKYETPLDGGVCTSTAECGNPDFYCGGATTKRCVPLCTVCSCLCYGGQVCNETSGVCEVPSSTGGSATSGQSSTASGGISSGVTSGGSGTGHSATGSSGASTSGTSGHASSTSGAATSSSGATSSGTTTGGGTGTYAGGCSSRRYYGTELQDCGGGLTPCACGQQCVTDSNPTLGVLGGSGQYCETPCASSADCPDPDTNCENGSCTWNGCSSGNVYGTCDVSAPGAADGYCLPFDDQGSELDLCVVDGTAAVGGTCEVAPFANDPQAFCAGGDLCVVDSQLASSGTCFQGCNPSSGRSNCARPTTCTPLDNNVPDIGYCQ